MQISPRLGIFFLLIGMIFLATLVLMNEMTTVWNGAESWMLWNSLIEEGDTSFLPLMTIQLLDPEVDLFLFWVRLPGIILLLGGMALFFVVTQKVLGRLTSLLTVSVLACTVLMPNLSKLATADSWIFFTHVMFLIFLLRYLKKPTLHWQGLIYLSLLLGLLIYPLSTIILGTLLPAGLFFFHPQGKRMIRLNTWIFMILIGLLFYFGDLLNWERPGFVLGYFNGGFGEFLGYNLIGVLPFLGFVISGIWETLQKAKKGEELSVIIGLWIAGSLAAQSLSLQLALAFLIAKQMINYFHSNYPYKEFVRTGAILHLVLAFCLAFVVMTYGFSQFGGIGFRSGLAFSIGYWATSLIAVIGLFGMQKRFAWGGVMLSGLLVSFFFWVQLNPLVETRRGTVKDSMKKVKKEVNVLNLAEQEDEAFSNLWYYGYRYFGVVNPVDLKEAASGPVLLKEKYLEKLDSSALTDTLQLPYWTDRLERENLILVR